MIYRRIVYFGGVSLALALAVLNAQSANTTRVTGQQLEGTWNLTVSFAGGRPPAYPAVGTFLPSGAAIVSNALGASGPTMFFRGPAHGEWLRIGDRLFTGTIINFAFGQDGAYTTMLRTRLKMQLNDTMDGLTGFGVADFYDTTGKLLLSARFTLQGTRMVLDTVLDEDQP